MYMAYVLLHIFWDGQKIQPYFYYFTKMKVMFAIILDFFEG